jgi:uncharacterized membrane protein
MFPGFLISVVVALLVVGLILWLLSIIPGIDPTIMQIIRAVVIICVVLWLISILLGYGGGIGPTPGGPYLRR